LLFFRFFDILPTCSSNSFAVTSVQQIILCVPTYHHHHDCATKTRCSPSQVYARTFTGDRTWQRPRIQIWRRPPPTTRRDGHRRRRSVGHGGRASGEARLTAGAGVCAPRQRPRGRRLPSGRALLHARRHPPLLPPAAGDAARWRSATSTTRSALRDARRCTQSLTRELCGSQQNMREWRCQTLQPFRLCSLLFILGAYIV
jgi:hypothetical protein